MSSSLQDGPFNCKNLNKLVDVFCVCVYVYGGNRREKEREKEKKEREIKEYICRMNSNDLFIYLWLPFANLSDIYIF